MKIIALFNHHPECSNQCCDGMIRALSPHYKIKLFGVNDDLKQVLSDVDCVAFPGGIGDSDSFYQFFKRRHGNAIESFISDGGRYLGICMGQYWAGSEYFDLLRGIDVVQYIKQPRTEIKRPYGTVAEITYESDFSKDKMFFYDGGAVVETDIHATYQVKARYRNGEPMALIQNNVGIIGCHPESEKFWYEMYPYIKDHWHEGRHHKWLLEFVDELMESWPSGLRHLTANETNLNGFREFESHTLRQYEGET